MDFEKWMQDNLKNYEIYTDGMKASVVKHLTIGWNAALEEVKKHGRIVKSEGGIETFVLTENIDNLKK